MFAIPKPSVFQAQKCQVTYGLMAHVDGAQPATFTKKKPYKAFAELDFIHSLDVIVPKDIEKKVEGKLEQVTKDYGRNAVRVTMTLGDMLTGMFFEKSFKEGKVMMLSEVRADAQIVFTCINGTLTMYLDKETYERSGLQGSPVNTKENRAHKSRWIVKLDLTASSMVPGKKGFDRVIYACKNVFTDPLKWIYINLDSQESLPDYITPFYPSFLPTFLSKTTLPTSILPFPALLSDLHATPTSSTLSDLAPETYEWASLLRLESPRLHPADSIDPYLSRYSVPIFSSADPTVAPATGDVVKFSWKGLVAPGFVAAVARGVVEEVQSGTWGFVAGTTAEKGVAGGSREAAMMRLPKGKEYLLWEIR